MNRKEILTAAGNRYITQRWIPAEERLPEAEGLDVKVCIQIRHAVWLAFSAALQNGGWWDGRTWWRTEGTYWMPLSEPPEETAR